MKYQYTIRGRKAGVPDNDNLYSGVIGADSPTDALVKALAAEFGDSDDGPDPMQQLTVSGWMDLTDLQAAMDDMDCTQAGHHCVEFAVGDLMFDVMVRLSDEAIVQAAESHAPSDIDSVRASERFVN